MIGASKPAVTVFGPWEAAIIGQESFLLSPVEVEEPSPLGPIPVALPVLRDEAALGGAEPSVGWASPVGEPPAAAPNADVAAESESSSAWRQHSGFSRVTEALHHHPVEPQRRPGSRMKRLALVGLALPAAGFAALVWVGKHSADPADSSDSVTASAPTFDTPIKLAPSVAPVADHRPEQLGSGVSASAPVDILAKASDGASSVTQAGVAGTAGAPSKAVPPAAIVPRSGPAVPVPLPSRASAEAPPSPPASARSIPRPASPAASGPPAGLFAIDARSARPASAPSRSAAKPPVSKETSAPPAVAAVAAPDVVQPVVPPTSALTPVAPLVANPTPTAPMEPGMGKAPAAALAAPAAAPVAAVGPRKAVYGRSGILALTPSSVIVYDRERRVQSEVRVGGVLPDGSRVLGVQPTRHRVDTDRGPLDLTDPASTSNLNSN